MPENEVAGVAGLPEALPVNGCDSSTAVSEPNETAANPSECRTFELESRDHSPAIATIRDRRGQQIDGGSLYPAGEEHPLTLQAEIARISAKHAKAQLDIDVRLTSALYDAGRSALGMPGTVDTFKAMLAQAGLVLVLA